MDYLQIYKNQFDATWEHIKSQTIADLKTAKKNKRNFNKLFNIITTELYKEQKKIVTQFTEQNLKVCYELFENRHREYDSNLERYEVISLILENEVKEEYLRLGKSDNEEFVKKIATQQSIDRIQNHFNNYRPYYELIYLQNKYEYFYAKDFKNGSYETSKEYLEMLDIQYPDRKSEPSLFNLIETESNKKSTENIKETDTVITTRERISNEFDVNERAVLFYLLKNRLKIKMLDSTELMRLILVIGATDRFEIFEGTKASDNYLYKQANKGYAVFKKTEQKDKIAQLKIKLINNGLKFIAEELQIDYSQFFNNKKLK